MRKKAIAAALCFVLAVCLFTSCSGKENAGKTLKLGTGNIGGNYYSYGLALDKLVRQKTEYGIEVVSSGGATANIRLISREFLDIAMTQNNLLTGTRQEGFHVVTGLYPESCHIVVPSSSDIKEIKDLRGRRLSLGELDSGGRKNAIDILDAANIRLSDIIETPLSFADATAALASGEIDAFFLTASIPVLAITNVSNDLDIRFIPLPEEIRDRIIETNPAYTKSTIPAGSYHNQNTDIPTIAVTAVLVASDKLVPEAEETLLKILNENNLTLQQVSFGKVFEEEKPSGIFKIHINLFLTMAMAVGVLYLGMFMRSKISFLEKFCIPSPVTGGLVFAILSCILYSAGIAEFVFDETLRDVCMILFFTSVGFQANFKVLKSGGIALVVFLVLIFFLILSQNLLALFLAKVMGVSPFIGLCTGSIPMVGGHGTAGAFGSVLEDLGLDSAITLCTASATFGLIMGSLMGGPLGAHLIKKRDLLKTAVVQDDSILVEDEIKHRKNPSLYASAAYQLMIAMGLGTIISHLLSKSGMTFPVYIGAMIVAAIMRNWGEFSGKFSIHMGEIADIGGICLSLFLGIAMMTLKLWQLADLALPLLVMLMGQALLMFVFAYFIIFNAMGRNYDAAILTAGTCGFGMGATPNAMVNMQVLTDKYLPSVKAYLLVPIVGGMFADFINSLVLTLFINLV